MLNTQIIDGVAAPHAAFANADSGEPDYDIEIVRELGLARMRLEAIHGEGAATPFQQPDWITAWYETLAPRLNAEPFLVFVTERETGRSVVALPLIRHRVGEMDVIAFADLGVTDYNAPMLGPAAPATPQAARALWSRIIVKALPAADLIELRKMPATIQGRPNPFAQLRGVHPAHSPGFSVTVGDDWEEYRRSLAKKFRKELGRSLRLFEKEGGAPFRRIESIDEALRILDVMTAQQRARLEEMGTKFALQEDAYQAFYEGFVRKGLENGTAILTALTCGDEIVAALLGVTNGESFAMVRLGHAGGDWMKIGPGRLIIERTMHMLHGEGCRHFDFSIGDYPYKAGFGVTPSPMHDFVAPLSWRGRIHAAKALAKAKAKQWLEGFGVSLVPKKVKERYARYYRAG